MLAEEVPCRDEGVTCFSSPAHLAFENRLQRNQPVECVIDVAAIHADEPLAGPEGCQVLGRKAIVADEEPASLSGRGIVNLLKEVAQSLAVRSAMFGVV
jgi:hypothetical protein